MDCFALLAMTNIGGGGLPLFTRLGIRSLELLNVIARSVATKQSIFILRPHGLLRVARNDEYRWRGLASIYTAWHPISGVTKRHCEERSDEAIHLHFATTWIASRCSQ